MATKKKQSSPKIIPALKWSSLDFEKNIPSGRKLKLILLLSFFSILILGYQKDVAGIVIFLLGILFYLLYLNYAIPRLVRYALTNEGLFEDDLFHSFASFYSFWIIQNKDIKKLYMAPIEKYKPALEVNIPESIGPQEIRLILLKKIPESKHQESLIDKTVRFFGL